MRVRRLRERNPGLHELIGPAFIAAGQRRKPHIMYYLNEAQQESLLRLPKTGMGYQLVEVTTLSFRRIVGVAYNAEVVLEKDEPEQRALFRAFASGMQMKSYGHAVREVRLLSQASAEYRAFRVGEARGAYAIKSGPANDAPVVTTNPKEGFKRFSAYENDRRIRADGSLEPGTYATTEVDARQVRTGKDAVARYALPNPEPAVNVFTITPVTSTLIQYGVAQPAYGQSGGGVEVIFTNGTAAKTVTGPDKIPPS
jgi:hypothetical protein